MRLDKLGLVVHMALASAWVAGPSPSASAWVAAPPARQLPVVRRRPPVCCAAPPPCDALPVEPDCSEPCNVVLTHTNTDFDSLAGAVALAKLWSFERPDCPTHVVMPRGINPLVARFLAYHKHLLPIRGFNTIAPSDVRAVADFVTGSNTEDGAAAALKRHLLSQ